MCQTQRLLINCLFILFIALTNQRWPPKLQTRMVLEKARKIGGALTQAITSLHHWKVCSNNIMHSLQQQKIPNECKVFFKKTIPGNNLLNCAIQQVIISDDICQMHLCMKHHEKQAVGVQFHKLRSRVMVPLMFLLVHLNSPLTANALQKQLTLC